MWAIGILTTTVSEKGKVISSQVQHLLDHVHVKLRLRHGKQQSIMKLMVWMQVQYRQLNQIWVDVLQLCDKLLERHSNLLKGLAFKGPMLSGVSLCKAKRAQSI